MPSNLSDEVFRTTPGYLLSIPWRPSYSVVFINSLLLLLRNPAHHSNRTNKPTVAQRQYYSPRQVTTGKPENHLPGFLREVGGGVALPALVCYNNSKSQAIHLTPMAPSMDLWGPAMFNGKQSSQSQNSVKRFQCVSIMFCFINSFIYEDNCFKEIISVLSLCKSEGLLA